ncbi:MAG: hypothetical protein F4Y00_02710 [Bacteroidetes bacterium SB0662_bin_6]|nr:hypothetical protein [Bacteroidetes bacterium SB0668_bin_1]MYE03871.1 hypothetical protein [Bacteroidetes bacterium SB0662_bin_6]
MEETEDMLTRQEVDALLTAIGTGFQALSTDSVVNDVISGAIPEEDDTLTPEDLLAGIPVDTTYACSEGGSMNLQGRVTLGTSDGGGLVPNYDFSFAPSGCVVTVENTTFTLDSQSGMREQGMISFEGPESDNAVTITITQTSTSTGMVDWELDDRSGMCDIDLSTDITVSLTLGADPDADIPIFVDTDVEGGTSGTLCDIEVNRPAEVPENPEDLLGPATEEPAAQ